MEEILAQEDPRENLNVVFIGHVDAGKSTICGSIMLHTGMVDKRTIEKYEREAKIRNRESWFLAYIMDTNEEERSKGITVEVGRAYFETEHKRARCSWPQELRAQYDCRCCPGRCWSARHFFP